MRVCVCAAGVAIIMGFAAPAMAAPVRTGYELTDISPSAITPIVFVDALKQSTPWSSSGPLSLDGDGQPTGLAPGQTAQRVVFAPGQAHPTGTYTLLYDGLGSFEVDGGAIAERTSGRIVVAVASNSRPFNLRLTGLDPRDPARNVRLILPGFEDSYSAHPFYPRFVASLMSAQTLRFAAWSHAASFDRSAVWTLRSRASRVTQAADSGVAPEYEIALANATGANPWFNLPVGATDAYVYGVADLAHRLLDPRLHPTFEYGDRMWAAGTPSNAYARVAARNVGLPGDADAGALEWYALRSTQVFAVIDRAYGGASALVSHALSVPGAVIAFDSAVSRSILAFAGAARRADTLVVDANVDSALANTLALSRAAGGPTEAWQPLGNGRWGGTGMPVRVPVVPNARLTFVAGDDFTPRPERRGRPPLALHITALLSSKLAFPRVGAGPGLAAALGEPQQDVDLTREGVLDWTYASAPGSVEFKATGGRQILVQSIAGVARPATKGFSTFEWSDGALRVTGIADRGVGVSGAGEGVSITAPADSTARVLRVYVTASSARGALTVHLEGRTYQDESLAGQRAARDGVYTIVYRASFPGRIQVAYTAASIETLGGGVGFRAATLAPFGARSNTVSLDQATYHNDQFRSGWNHREAVLNVANVSSAKFGRVNTLKVDGAVLAQPLYLSQYPLPGRGMHNIVVVATEHNSIYEFDADSGALLKKINLGKAQPTNDVGCTDIRPEYGISSTPVIDRATGTIYVVAATEPSPFEFHTTLHALDIATLHNIVPPVEIRASTTISNGNAISFDRQNQMNRAGLVLANNSIYVGIGSHCDNNANNIIGWVLRYDLALNRLGTFATAEDTDAYLLSSVWMTGFAPPVDEHGNLYVVTGNGTFDAQHGGRNFGESVLRLPAGIAEQSDYFTPQNWNDLNNGDVDFGSGGIMLLPPQQAAVKHVAVTQGKASTIFLLDRYHLGNLQPNDAGALQTITNTGGGVWGGPAYYNGPTGQFVYYQAGGAPLLAFSVVQNSNNVPQLQLSSTGTSYSGYGGSLPVVSSDGQMPGTGIVWLINRSQPLQLEAYDATDVSHLLFQGAAGVWRNPALNAFVTPLVANGKVYVPAFGTIAVFGLGGSRLSVDQPAVEGLAPGEHRITGTIVRVTRDALTLRLRDGRLAFVDLTLARGARHLGMLPVNRAVSVFGTIDRAGAFHATSVGHTSPNVAQWPRDH